MCNNKSIFWGFRWVRNKALYSMVLCKLPINSIASREHLFLCFSWHPRRETFRSHSLGFSSLPLHNFFLLRRSKEPLRSLTREVCSPPRGPLPLHAQSLLWELCLLLMDLLNSAVISKKPNTVHNPLSKTLRPWGFLNSEIFQILERIYVHLQVLGQLPIIKHII